MCDLVNLNVGGVTYTTSRTTLTAYPDSMLGRMFGGELPTATDTDGRYFIDRDGPLFRFLLNFLRTRKLSVPDDFSEWKQLQSEADFFQVEPFIRAVESEIVSQKADVTRAAIIHDLHVMEHIRLFPVSYGDMSRRRIILIGNRRLTDLLSIRYDMKSFKTYAISSSSALLIVQCKNPGEISYYEYRESITQRLGTRVDIPELSEILLSAGCTLVSSTSESADCVKDTITGLQVTRFHRWSISESSLEKIASLPK